MYKILIIRLSSMGDVVMQTSLIFSLKETYGDSLVIDYLTFKEFSSLIEDVKEIRKVISLDRVRKLKGLFYLKEFSKTLKNYDLIVDLHGTTRSMILRKFLFKIPHICVDKRRIERYLLVKFKINFLKNKNEPYPQVKRLIDDFRFYFKLNKITPRTLTSIACTDESVKEIFNLDKYIVLAPSASFVNKRWPVQSFIDLAQIIFKDERFNSYKVVVLAGPEDDFCNAFDQLNDERILNLQSRTSLSQSALLIKDSKALVGNDSGLGHIANSCSVPLVTIFGPTSEYFGFIPYGKRATTLSTDTLDCRPCSTTGSRPCKFNTLKCMEAVSANQVFDSLVEVMSK